jgi:hypothetical protein
VVTGNWDGVLWKVRNDVKEREGGRNDTIRPTVYEVTEEKLLRWFGHVMRMTGNRFAAENHRTRSRGS